MGFDGLVDHFLKKGWCRESAEILARGMLQGFSKRGMVSDVSLFKRIVIRIFGHIYLEHRLYEGWTESLPFYLAKCSKHGYYESYPHGYEQELRCPKCLEESWK